MRTASIARHLGAALVVCLHAAGCRPAPATTTPATTPAATPDASTPAATQPERPGPEVGPEVTPEATPPVPAVQPTPVATRKITVGKWPEGVTLVDGKAWVAESGDRKVARVDLATGKVETRVAIGRLPTSMVTGPDGAIYALVVTDSVIKVIRPGKKTAELFAKLPDHAEHMVLADGALWVLLWGEGSSATGTVLRVDLKTRKQTRSGDVGEMAFKVAVGHGKVWVARGRQNSLTVLDAASLQPVPGVAATPSSLDVLAGPAAVYLGTREDVQRIDPSTLQVTHKAALGRIVAALVYDGDAVLVATDEGHVWSLAAGDLAVRKIWRPEGASSAHALVRSGAELLLSQHDGDVGTLLLFTAD